MFWELFYIKTLQSEPKMYIWMRMLPDIQWLLSCDLLGFMFNNVQKTPTNVNIKQTWKRLLTIYQQT